jgi:hypothetical protein
MIKNPNQTKANSVVANELQKQGDLAEQLAQANAKRNPLRKRPEEEALAVDGQPIPEHAHGADDALPDPLAADDSLVPLGTATTDPYAYIQNEILARNDIWATENFDSILVAQDATGAGAAGGGAGGGAAGGAAGGGGGGAAAGGGAAGGGAAGGAAAGGAAAGGAAGGGFVGAGVGVAGGAAVGAGAAVAAGAAGGGDSGPSEPPTINNFKDYLALAPVVAGAELTLAATYSGTQNVYVFGGFDRSELPLAYPGLAPLALYDANTSGPSGTSSTTDAVEDPGLRINLASDANAEVYVTASAGIADTSDLIWMRNLGIYEQATGEDAASADAYIEVNAYASGVVGEDSLPADAEVGIGNLGIHLQGTGDLHGSIFVNASAQNGTADAFAQANVQIDNLTVEVSNLSSSSSVNAHAYLSLYAEARTAAIGNISVFQDVVVAAHAASAGEGIRATAELNGVFAYAEGNFASTYSGTVNSSGSATVVIDGSINVSASSMGSALAYIDYISASADRNAFAGVSVGGDVYVEAAGSHYGLAYLHQIDAVAASGSGQDAIASAEVVIDGDVVVNAVGLDGGSATAYIEYITTYAQSTAVAGVHIAGNLSVDAHAMATTYSGAFGENATAYIHQISASAYSTASAQVAVDGDISVHASADAGNAYAYIQQMTAHAWTLSALSGDTTPDAGLSVGGDVVVSAVAEDVARANVYSIVASASGGTFTTYSGLTGASAEVDIAGQLSVEATGGVIAVAYINSIEAHATYTGAEAQVQIGGISVRAEMTGEDSMGEDGARAYVGGITAMTRSSGAVAGVTVDGNVTVSAEAANGYATAFLGSIYASADGGAVSTYTGMTGGSASVTIQGNLVVSASATDGNASAYIDSIQAYAINGNARVEINGNEGISVHAHAAGTEATYSGTAINTYSGAVATTFYAQYGPDATASVQAISATAYFESSSAELSIAGNVQVSASAASGSASANLDYIRADHQMGGAEAYVSIGGNVNVTASAHGSERTDIVLDGFTYNGMSGQPVWSTTYQGNEADAGILQIAASATLDGVGSVDIAGSVNVGAYASAGTAQALVGDIGADADQEGAWAAVSIGGDVTVVAEGDRIATASLYGIHATASYGSSYSGAAATISIDGDVSVRANAHEAANEAGEGYALAYVDYIEAQAYYSGAEAHVVIDGAVNVAASASGHWMSNYAIPDGSSPYVQLQQGIDARAYVAGITASAYNENSAALVIGANLSGTAAVAISAYASNGSADAYLGEIGAYAKNVDARANVSINGDVSVHAEANGWHQEVTWSTYSGAVTTTDISQVGNNASAFIGSISAYAASNSNASGNVLINGDVAVRASAEGSATAYINHLSAYAGQEYGRANVSINGDVQVNATAGYGFDEDYNDANAFIASIYASAQYGALTYSGNMESGSAGAEAGVAIAGNVSVSAYAPDGSASAYIDYINAKAYYSGAEAYVLVQGDVHVEAYAAGSYQTTQTVLTYSGATQAVVTLDVNNSATAYIGEISASAYTSNNAGVLIGGFGEDSGGVAVDVSAYAADGSASAYIDYIYAYAWYENAGADVLINGGIDINAQAHGEHEVLNTFGFTYSGISSEYSVDTVGNGADAFIDGIYVAASNTGADGIFVVNGNVSINADAQYGSATAYLGNLSAYAHGINAEANASIFGDVTVTARGGDDAEAAVVSIFAQASYGATYSGAAVSTYSGNFTQNASAQVTIDGNVSVHASANAGSAYAYVALIGANAYADAAEAHISIAGDVSVRADAQGMRENVSIVWAYSNATTDMVSVSVGNDASASIGTISASAYTDSLATVTLGDGEGTAVLVSADASSGDAWAYIGSINATGDNGAPGAESRVSIYGDVNVLAYASGTQEEFHFSGYTASSSGGEMIYSVDTRGNAASAIIGQISASAYTDSLGSVLIDGTLTVRADSDDGGATAYLGYISAEASYTNAHAEVSINGDVNVQAYGGTGAGEDDTFAGIWGIDANASYGVATTTGMGTAAMTNYGQFVSAPMAEINISGDVRVTATATDGSASAYIDYIQAEARHEGAYADVSINGNVSVQAEAAGSHTESAFVQTYSGDAITATAYTFEAGNSATAYIDQISAVGDEGDATITLGAGEGDAINVTASAQSGSAYAYLGIIEANAGVQAEAHVSIQGDVTVRAQAGGSNEYLSYRYTSVSASWFATSTAVLIDGNDAVAYLGREGSYGGGIQVNADTAYASANVSITGDVNVSATATAGSAYAYLEYVAAYASGTGAEAYVDVRDIRVSASGEDYAQAGIADISAVVIGGNTTSTGLGLDADVFVGSVSVTAEAASGSANAYIEYVGAYANGTNGQAMVAVEGDLNVQAHAREFSYVSGSTTFFTGSNATAYIGEIGAVANPNRGSMGDATVYVIGDISVLASAEAADASAHIDSIYAYASANQANANVAIVGYYTSSSFSSDGDINVTAIGAGEVLAYISNISAAAVDNGSANVGIMGDIHVSAGGLTESSTAPDALSAYARITAVNAVANSTGTASVSIGGDISLDAYGQNDATTYLVVSASTDANSSSYATVNIDGSIHLQAIATEDSTDGDALSQLYIGARGNGVVNLGNTMPSFAVTTGSAGDVHVQATDTAAGATASAFVQIIAQDTADVHVGDVFLTVDADGGTALLDIYAEDDANISIGDVNLTVRGGATGVVQIAQDYATSSYTNASAFSSHTLSSTANIDIGNFHVNVEADATASLYLNNRSDFTTSGSGYVEGGAGVEWDAERTATLSGAGDVYMEITGQVFGTINGANTFSGHLDLNMWGERDDTAAADVQYTTLRGFTSGVNLENVSFEFSSASSVADFTTIVGGVSGRYVNQQTMLDEMDDALDGSNVYVFAVFNEQSTGNDINGDENFTQNLGVLGFDSDGDGISGVLYLPGIGVGGLDGADFGLTPR